MAQEKGEAMNDHTVNRNIGAITAEEQAILRRKTVLIAGCGGLGGYCAELLSRLGVGKLVLCDCDVFEESNLNRQLFCNRNTLGVNKAEAIGYYIEENDRCKVRVVTKAITPLNAYLLTDGCDLVIDALDNIATRFDLQRACKRRGIPMITGGVSHWHGQVSTIYPGDDTLEAIFGRNASEKHPPVLGFAACNIATCQVAEAAKILLGQPSLRKKLLMIDLNGFTAKIVPIEGQRRLIGLHLRRLSDYRILRGGKIAEKRDLSSDKKQ